jgi:hypothetical protein
MRPFSALPLALCCALASVALAGCGPGVVWFGKSPDRSRDAVVLQEDGGQRVRVDGRDGKTFLGIGIAAMAWSPDNSRLAYPARVAGGWVVVVDGVEGAVFAGVGEIVWSADSRHVAYAAEQRGRWVVVVDGKLGASFEALRARSLQLSDNGERVAFVAEDGGKVVAVVDGVKSAPYDAIGRLAFGSGGRVAFAARRGRESVLVADGKELEACEDIADIAFSPDGKRLVWTGRRKGGWHVIEGESMSAAHERISKIVWSPASDSFAYAAGTGSAEAVVFRGEIGAAYEGVMPGSLTFDATGAHIAYAARRRGAWRVVTDTAEGPPFEEVEPPMFVGESSAVAHIARRGEASFVVLDEHFGPVCAEASQLVLSRDGRRFMHAARSGLRVAVIEGSVSGGPCGGGRCAPAPERSRVHDVVVGGTLVFSDDGRHSGYLAGRAADRELFLMVDGAMAGRFDLNELMAGMALSPDLAGALMGDSKRLTQWVQAEVGLYGRRPSAQRRAR